jgi:hypothetical protein
MKLFDILKQFKNIEPDAHFSERSKREILLSPQTAPRTMRGVFAFLHVIETGAAVALAGFFILVLTGSFSPTRSIAPIQYAVIDPQGLQAEAQAVDMQIQLANVAYPQVTSTVVATTTLKSAFNKALQAQQKSASPVSTPATTTSTSTASTTLSVDQALQQLSR